MYQDDGDPHGAVEHIARLSSRTGAGALRAIAWDRSVDDSLCLESAGKLAQLCW
jgi:hypothetical protein